MFRCSVPRIVRIVLLSGFVTLFAVPVVAGPHFTRTSTIASGPEYHLFSIPLIAGMGVTATLVCDFNGVSRPLDPVLSVYFPGVDPSDTINASVYNDDGFGLDDSVQGTDRDAFDSSQVMFAAPVTGMYFFRAEGFGSSTGPYTLTINSRSVVTGTGTGSHVQAFAGVGSVPNWLTRSILAYTPSFNGGVRVASGDVNGDGTPDIVTGAGPGGTPHVRVIDGLYGGELRNFLAYGSGFTGGVAVALGDVNVDGRLDIITAPGGGSGPLVRVWDGLTGVKLREFLAYGAAFTGGVFVAAGDINGDGRDDIITTPGPGGGPNVRVFNGADGMMIQSFFAYGPAFTGGVFVGAGDVDGDGRDDIITAPGPGGGPNVKVFSGTNLAVLRNFLAFDAGFTGGVRVAAADLNGDGRADIITAPGPGGAPQVRVFSGVPALTMIQEYLAYVPGYLGGVFVAGR
jgi:hypothetical protein